MKPMLAYTICACLMLLAAIDVSYSAETSQGAKKAAETINGGPSRNATSADFSASVTPNADKIGVILPRQKFTGGTRR
jgi:hypothetical protein